MNVSCTPQLAQRGEPMCRMAYSHSFVGRMTLMTLNNLSLIASATHVAWRFAHTCSQAGVRYVIAMHTFLGGWVANFIILSASNILALKVLRAFRCLGILHMLRAWRKYASIPAFLECPRHGAGFPSAPVSSKHVAIQRLSLRHDDFASMSDIVSVLCTLFPHRLGTNPLSPSWRVVHEKCPPAR